MTKINPLPLIVLLSFFVLSCSDKSDEDNPFTSGCKLLSVYFNSDSTKMYHYDESGRLVLKWDLFEQGPAFLKSHYLYQNDRLVCFYRSPDDSTFFTYDSQGRISSYEWHNDTSGIRQIRITRFIYNSINQVITETSKTSVFSGSKGILPDDSTVYTYLDQNVKTRDYYYWYDTLYTGHQHYEYFYDSGKNYFSSTGEPMIKYYQWSRNNLIGISTGGYPPVTDSIMQYNPQGYPVLIHSVQGYNITLNYYCQ